MLRMRALGPVSWYLSEQTGAMGCALPRSLLLLNDQVLLCCDWEKACSSLSYIVLSSPGPSHRYGSGSRLFGWAAQQESSVFFGVLHAAWSLGWNCSRYSSQTFYSSYVKTSEKLGEWNEKVTQSDLWVPTLSVSFLALLSVSLGQGSCAPLAQTVFQCLLAILFPA